MVFKELPIVLTGVYFDMNEETGERWETSDPSVKPLKILIFPSAIDAIEEDPNELLTVITTIHGNMITVKETADQVVRKLGFNSAIRSLSPN